MYILIIDKTKHIRINCEHTSFPYEYKGIEIYKDHDDYYMNLNRDFHVSELASKIKLKYTKYLVSYNNNIDNIELFVYENDNGLNEYHLYEKVPFILGDNPRATIIPLDNYLKDKCLYLNKNILRTNSSTLTVNGKPYSNEALKDGDEIEFYNFKFIYHEEFLYINNFMIKNNLSIYKPKEFLLKYEHRKNELKNSYIPNKKELVIDELKPFNPPAKQKQKKVIYQIGPSLTMSFAMISIAGINVYNNYQNNQSILNSLVYILMPVTMLLSSVMWPLIITMSDRKNYKKEYKETKEKYENYLLEYTSEINKRISNYLNEENSYYFDGHVDKDKLFAITSKNNSFLDLSIGYVNKHYDLNYKKAIDVDILEKQSRIKYRLSNIENVPYFINLLSNQIISFVVDDDLKTYLIKRFILDISSKYSINDFYIAIYCKELYKYKEFLCIPQLIYNNKRLTFVDKNEVNKLNNIKFNKPLILFVDSPLSFDFTNENIHLLYFTKDNKKIYKNSDTVVEYFDKTGIINSSQKIEFIFDCDYIDFKKEIKLLDNNQNIILTNNEISFKDILGEINIENLYKEKQSGLKADFASAGNELLSFDLHETKNGPHGLIGGSTGSGKSELIISMLLSLCLRYRPDYLNIILIDYKGGGIEDSLSSNGVKVPHIIASISNLQSDTFERLIVAIDYECKRRQKLFKELSNYAMTSIMNIDDYLENDYERYKLPKIAHLLIVVDEFAELKKENPEIIKELISFSRIGRSLGLHLILATQRPSGVIDDEIWSNSRFKIALKVLSENDSNDIIKNKEAAYLTKPGEFYLLVDGIITKAKSIYSKKDIKNGSPLSVSLLNNQLETIKKKTVKHKEPLKESTYIIEKILEATNNLNIKTNELSFSKPIRKTKEELKEIYNFEKKDFVIGEVDDYLNNKKDIISVSYKENILLFSTRRNEINNFINNATRDVVAIGSKYYRNHKVIDSLLYEDIKDIKYLFDKLAKYNGELSLIIEDLSTLLGYIDDISNILYSMLRRDSININLIVLTKQSAINYKLVNCFKNKYAIEINDNQDLINIFSSYSKYKGKSFYFNDNVVSFVPVKEEDLVEDVEMVQQNFIERIPEQIDDDKLGYDEKTRMPIFINENKKVLITSYNEKILNIFTNEYGQYSNIDISLYDKAIIRTDYSQILWLGDGLYSQRMFYVDGNKNLASNQGYFIEGNKEGIIRTINYE